MATLPLPASLYLMFHLSRASVIWLLCHLSLAVWFYGEQTPLPTINNLMKMGDQCFQTWDLIVSFPLFFQDLSSCSLSVLLTLFITPSIRRGCPVPPPLVPPILTAHWISPPSHLLSCPTFCFNFLFFLYLRPLQPDLYGSQMCTGKLPEVRHRPKRSLLLWDVIALRPRVHMYAVDFSLLGLSHVLIINANLQRPPCLTSFYMYIVFREPLKEDNRELECSCRLGWQNGRCLNEPRGICRFGCWLWRKAESGERWFFKFRNFYWMFQGNF